MPTDALPPEFSDPGYASRVSHAEAEMYELGRSDERLILDKEITRLRAQRNEALNLLAVIHRDGGHYETEHGFVKAVKDAEALVLTERAQLAEYEGIEGRCSVGHNKKFTYELEGRVGCVACERDEAQREVERLRTLQLPAWQHDPRTGETKLIRCQNCDVVEARCARLETVVTAIKHMRATQPADWNEVNQALALAEGQR